VRDKLDNEFQFVNDPLLSTAKNAKKQALGKALDEEQPSYLPLSSNKLFKGAQNQYQKVDESLKIAAGPPGLFNLDRSTSTKKFLS